MGLVDGLSRWRTFGLHFYDGINDENDRLDAQKKTPVAYERECSDVVAKRKAFLARQPTLDSRRLVFLDESGFRLGSTPRFGWAPRGKKAPGKAVCGRWENVTLIGAIALDGFRGLMTMNAGTSVEVFLAYVEQCRRAMSSTCLCPIFGLATWR